LTPCNIVILGLTITSSWGNGHATTYRGLMRELVKNGHNVLFLERDMPWYAKNRDVVQSPFGQIELYTSVDDLKNKFKKNIISADFVMLGSYVPEGIVIADWITSIAKGITAFYDIDTPVTLAKLAQQNCDYLLPQLIPRFDLYLSFAGGPILDLLMNVYGAFLAKPLFCSVDPDSYYPGPCKIKYDLGYMGTFSADRQGSLDRLMFEPARKMDKGQFVVAGPLYPDKKLWPGNVNHLDHVAPSDHREFYCSQRFTLNLTRADMVLAGYAPSVRLFEAAACGVPIISDYWNGLDSLFTFNEEILLSASSEQTLDYLKNI
jgi:spore maturation protein CgeB